MWAHKALRGFAWRRKAKGQRDNYCRPCRADYKQEHYRKNRERYISNANRRRRRVRDENIRYLIDYLRHHPCVDCGEKDVLVLDFDHLGEKRFNVSHGVAYRPWEDLLTEIAKCEVVCANCHRRRSAERGGYFRVLVAQRGTQSG